MHVTKVRGRLYEKFLIRKLFNGRKCFDTKISRITVHGDVCVGEGEEKCVCVCVCVRVHVCVCVSMCRCVKTAQVIHSLKGNHIICNVIP